MKRLLLVAAVAAVMSQDALGMANTTRLQPKCAAGYSFVGGKCQKLVGPGGTRQALPANVNAKFARPAMNTRGGIQRQNIGGNSATWAPAMNTQGGIQRQQLVGPGGTQRALPANVNAKFVKPAMNTRGGIQKQNIGGNSATWTPAMNTQGGVRKLVGGNTGGSY